MTFFKSLIGTLISESTKRSSKSKSFFTLCSTAQQPFLHSNPRGAATSVASTFFHTPFLSHNHRLFDFRRHGPLFLFFPPWKLSQSATPLLLQGDLGLLNLPPKFNSALDFRYTFCYKYSPKKLLKEGSDGIRESDNGIGEFSSSKLAIANSEASDGAVRITDSYVNLPNFISLGRLLSGPLLGWMITHEMYAPAFIGLALSGASDWLDGYVARKMGINSVVGSYLDPLADKVLIAFVTLAMVERGLLHLGLVALVVLRDVALIGGAVYKRASSLEWKWKSWFDFFNLDGTRPEKVEPHILSKVNTVFQLVLVAAALLQPGFGNEETEVFIIYLSWLVASTTVGSTVAYGRQHLKKIPQLLKN